MLLVLLMALVVAVGSVVVPSVLTCFLTRNVEADVKNEVPFVSGSFGFDEGESDLNWNWFDVQLGFKPTLFKELNRDPV